MLRLSISAVFLSAITSISPAAAETIRLHVESGAIVGIKDRQGGRLEVYLTIQSQKDLWSFTGRNIGKKVDLVADGKVILSSIIREQILGPNVPVADPMTDAARRETIADLVEGRRVLEMRLSAQ